jgi:glycosyltransferase involved in cell wall biosynthesis
VLAQTYADFEIVVSDNASTDGTVDVVRSFRDSRIRLNQNPANVGCYPNHNIAWRLSTGDLITFLDSDDSYEPHRLATLVRTLDEYPNAVFAYNAVALVSGNGVVQEILRSHPESTVLSGTDELRYQLGYNTGKMGIVNPPLVRRQAMEKVGGYDIRFAYAGDRHLHWRLCILGQVAYCAEPLYRYLVHPYAFDRDPFLVAYEVYDSLRSFLEDFRDDAGIERITYKALRDHRASVARNWIVRAFVSSHRDPLRIVSPLSLLAMAFSISPQTFLKIPFSPRVWRKLAEHEAKSRV